MIIELVKQSINIGDTLQNPGCGTSNIIGINEIAISYRRGKSRMQLPCAEIESAYARFKGRQVSSRDLHELNPCVFDSKRGGHSCNATFFLMVMVRSGLADGGIRGEGKAGKPFYVVLR